MAALPPFCVAFDNTVVGRDPANPPQDKTVCKAFGYSGQEARFMAVNIANSLNNSRYIFKDHVFLPPYSPYYDKYRGHEFSIHHFHDEDNLMMLVWLECETSHGVLVDGYVNLLDIQLCVSP
jgi:hypothetical protein